MKSCWSVCNYLLSYSELLFVPFTTITLRAHSLFCSANERAGEQRTDSISCVSGSIVGGDSRSGCLWEPISPHCGRVSPSRLALALSLAVPTCQTIALLITLYPPVLLAAVFAKAPLLPAGHTLSHYPGRPHPTAILPEQQTTD